MRAAAVRSVEAQACVPGSSAWVSAGAYLWARCKILSDADPAL